MKNLNLFKYKYNCQIMEFLDNPQDLCLDNTHCRDDYCTKNHPRCLEGICIGYLK